MGSIHSAVSHLKERLDFPVKIERGRSKVLNGVIIHQHPSDMTHILPVGAMLVDGSGQVVAAT